MGTPSDSRPTFHYDPCHPLLARLVPRWRQRTGDKVRYLASEGSGLSEYVRYESSSDQGYSYQGFEAILCLLAVDKRGRRQLWIYRRLPGAAPLSDYGHQIRMRYPRSATALATIFYGRDLRPTERFWTRWLFLRALGLVTLLAFGSWWSQADGLVGPEGIAPSHQRFERITEVSQAQGWSTWQAFKAAPSLLWPKAEDNSSVNTLCLVGVIAASLLLLNLLPGIALLACLACYLSLISTGSVFMGYQWDALLIESLTASLLLVPWTLRPKLARNKVPSRAAFFVLKILLFKLFFLSGVVKLNANDAPWDELTALTYHYWTQPLPNPLSWYAHHLPVWLHSASCALMLAIEIGLPFAVFGPRRLRQLACAGFATLMLVIVLTGNYGFFNLLSLVLCLALLDDRSLRQLLPSRLSAHLSAALRWMTRPQLPQLRCWPRMPPFAAKMRRRLTHWLTVGAASTLVLLQIVPMGRTIDRQWSPPKVLVELHSELASFRLVNSYGLFANMTESRPEIIIEGSHDGLNWQRYDFPYKIDGVDDAPTMAWPGHMPRLDWQLWFAALRGKCRGWVVHFFQRLLEGSPSVSKLIGHDPFQTRPPRYLRSTLISLEFSSPEHYDNTGHRWITRGPTRPLCPIVELHKGSLRRAARLPTSSPKMP